MNKETTIRALFFIIPKEMDNWMQRLDLGFDEHKRLIVKRIITITTYSRISSSYFQRLIDKSKRGEVEIAAIYHQDEWYFQKGIECLSDGKKEMWVEDLKKCHVTF